MKKVDGKVVGFVLALIVVFVFLYFVFKKPIDKTVYQAYNQVTTPFKYFTFSEFDSPDEPGSGKAHMNVPFIEMLDKARGIAGIPFKVNSGYRTVAHNNELANSVPNSAHLSGLAADISTPTEDIKKKIAKALYAVGFKRLGFANTFIHVDNDLTKPQFAFNYSGAHIYTESELA